MSPQRVQRKPLELHVFPPIPECPRPSDLGYAYEDWFDDRAHERKLTAKKRLSDAELAAEVHFFVMADFKYPDDPDMLSDEEWTELSRQHREAEAALHRFATHPDHDEPAP